MIVSLLLLPRCVFYTTKAFSFQGNKFFGSGDQLKGQFPFSFSSSSLLYSCAEQGLWTKCICFNTECLTVLVKSLLECIAFKSWVPWWSNLVWARLRDQVTSVLRWSQAQSWDWSVWLDFMCLHVIQYLFSDNIHNHIL